jgi:hypothetical protein
MSEALQAQVKAGPATPLTPAHAGMLQRKCACGSSASVSGQCHQCKDKEKPLQRYSNSRTADSLLGSLADSSFAAPPKDSQRNSASTLSHSFGKVKVHTRRAQKLQPKLSISSPTDEHEQEANRAAELITGASQHSAPAASHLAPPLSSTQPRLQRSPADEKTSAELSPSPAADEKTSAEPSPSPGADEKTSAEPSSSPAADEKTSAEPSPSPAAATSEPASQTGAAEQSSPAGLIVDDNAVQLAPAQMRKTQFLDQLQSEVRAAADAELVSVGSSAQGCPYIENWIGYYRSRPSQYVERALRKYAPDAAAAASAGDYIPLVAQRVRRAVSVWATTGEITGVPEGVAASPPDEASTGETSTGETAAPAQGGVQLKSRGGVHTGEAHDPAAIQSQLGSGRSLDGSARSRMESAFGYDFSPVRVHTDGKAAELSSGLNARAFTIGSDIAFASGEYQPGTLIGDALLAHELAHVVQQRGAVSADGPMQKGESRYGSLEEDADTSAVGAVVSLWAGTKDGLAHITQNAMPRMKSGLRLQRCNDEKEKSKPKEEEKAPAPAGDAGATAGCGASFTGVTFSLANQTASGTKPAVAFQIGKSGGKDALAATGIAPAKYKPKITISAPSDAKAKEYEVGLIQNLLTDKRETTFTAGGPILTKMPVPIKDGAPKGSGAEDDVFAENGSGHPGILVGFSTKGDTASLKLPDTPGDFGFINLKDNAECAGSKVNGTMTGMTLKDSFRTWIGVRHKSSKCIKTIHHIDWNIDWAATVNGAASPPTHSVTSDALNVTEANGNGSPTFVSGGKVPAELIATARKCGP